LSVAYCHRSFGFWNLNFDLFSRIYHPQNITEKFHEWSTVVVYIPTNRLLQF
jgi:hypothetical protein